MTPSPTSVERANQAIDKWLFGPKSDPNNTIFAKDLDELRSGLAKAIDDYRAETLEEAAKVAETLVHYIGMSADDNSSSVELGAMAAKVQIAEEIRRLKEEK